MVREWYKAESTQVEIPEWEVVEPGEFERIDWNPVAAQNRALEELFSSSRKPMPRMQITLGLCSVCKLPFRKMDLSAKRISFGPINNHDQAPRRERVIAWLCPTCLIQDIDFRRPGARSAKQHFYNTENNNHGPVSRQD